MVCVGAKTQPGHEVGAEFNSGSHGQEEALGTYAPPPAAPSVGQITYIFMQALAKTLPNNRFVPQTQGLRSSPDGKSWISHWDGSKGWEEGKGHAPGPWKVRHDN